ncbi:MULTISPECIES: serine hydrolase [unclassified Crossiella]|uniref:serine hydrolase domain-containing protein n=1 Tax=unclassified Crossiella TaxID=2620835 RepID=UPI001FFE5401|nr:MULTISPECIES: serine hydrolase domain-containing protein [unclassified Crossiella]MCK2244191.1 beta-lactamase family protein [Crossiella sp. S99.2]MCK2257995.1 beta-lactamase family protein [Crossiella sp. S99.1]
MKRSSLARSTAAVAAVTVSVALACTGAIALAAEGYHGNKVQQRLDSLVRNDKFPAALASVDGRNLVAGAADKNDRVRIGSNTKVFVAVAVLQLVGEGKIELDKPIEKYLPNLVRGKGIDGNNITVRELLQHTNGLPNYTNYIGMEKFQEARDRYLSPRDALDAALAQPAMFEPGKKWYYNNTGYTLAGLLIEKVTGRPVAEVVTERVIKPAGLRDTYWPNVGERDIRGKHAKGYAEADGTKPGGPIVDATRQDTGWGWAAGELVGTPSDLSRFFAELFGGKLLRPAELAELKRTVVATDVPGNPGYGLGVFRTELSCGKVLWWHGGSIPGYETRGGVTEDGRRIGLAVTAQTGTYGDPALAGRRLQQFLDATACDQR